MQTDGSDLVARLFAQEVPEIALGLIEIKAIARDPGYRCKLAVRSHDPAVDCAGTCVGVRGARIKNVVDALDGERIDIVRWNDAPEQLIRNALQPAAIEQVLLQPARHRATVIVKADQASLARGRRNLNRELASRFSGWQIEIEQS